MSALGLLSRPCQRSIFSPSMQNLAFTRQFSSSHVLLARQKYVKKKVLSKGALAALERRKAMKRGKSVYDKEKMTLDDAIHILRSVEVASPNAAYELTIKTQMPRGAAVPKGRISFPKEPKQKEQDRILVFAEGKAADDARKAGAAIVGGPELIDGILSGRHQATLFLCTPDLLRAITPRLGRVLGPRGLMPSARRGTVTENIAGYIRQLRGTQQWIGDKQGIIRTPIARLAWTADEVAKNVRHFLQVVKQATGNERNQAADEKQKALDRNKPVNSIQKVILSSRSGPGIVLSDF